jgi:hypothetical protein
MNQRKIKDKCKIKNPIHKFTVISIILISIILAGISLPSWARTCYPVTLELGPYVGFDVQQRNLRFQKGYGDNTFESHYPQGNLYVGLMLTENFGIELGYEKTLKRSRDSQFTGGDVLLGNTATAGSSGRFQSHGELYGPHINIIALYKPCDDYPLEIFGSIGAAYLTAKFDRNLVEFNNGPAASLRTFEQDKAIWRLGAGLQYLFVDCIGVRASLGFENTSQMRMITREVLANPPQVKLKDSLLWGLGLFYLF